MNSIKENNKTENLFRIYNTLNSVKDHYTSRDDICTPMECVKKMIDYIPNELWNRNYDIKVLDACCGNGNFGAYCMTKTNIDNIYFNDINTLRLDNCIKILNPKHILNYDILSMLDYDSFDLIMANPPYSGSGNKNKSISNEIIEHCVSLLKDKGYLCFITPNNWMTYNNNNITLKTLLSNGQFKVIDNDAKKYFPSVGSSFTIFIWQKGTFGDITHVRNSYLCQDEQNVYIPKDLPFIPLYLSQETTSLVKNLMSSNRNKFNYRCDLHNFTQKDKLQDIKTNVFRYKTIHTVKKTRYSCVKQDIYDKWLIIIPLSTYYKPYICHNVNVTQSVGYIAFDTETEAKKYLNFLLQDWVKVMIHITRYGNFNNIMVLKHIDFENHPTFSEKEISTVKMLSSKIKY